MLLPERGDKEKACYIACPYTLYVLMMSIFRTCYTAFGNCDDDSPPPPLLTCQPTNRRSCTYTETLSYALHYVQQRPLGAVNNYTQCVVVGGGCVLWLMLPEFGLPKAGLVIMDEVHIGHSLKQELYTHTDLFPRISVAIPPSDRAYQ